MANFVDTLPMDFISNEDFSAQRSETLREILALKHMRRVALGPDMTVVFEHPRLIWWHIQEMLRLEQGGSAQLQEEWAVYSPLLPGPDSITVTMMIEIHDPVVRKKELRKRVGIEDALFLEGAGFRIRSQSIDMGAGLGAGQENSQKSQEAQEKQGENFCFGQEGSGGSEQIKEAVQEDGTMVAREEDGAGADRLPSEDGASKKTSSVHFLRFPLSQWERKIFAMGEPVLSCQHPHALYRTPLATGLWNALCHEIGVVPLKY